MHRTSEAPRGVSQGLEKGWLAFVSDKGKRRLAPYPADWETASERELVRFWNKARIANPARFPSGERRVSGPALMGTRPKADARSERTDVPDDDRDNDVRNAVRAFARDARAQAAPAIEAMVRLKLMLGQRFAGDSVPASERADACDMRKVRKWFVEAYYFERTQP